MAAVPQSMTSVRRDPAAPRRTAGAGAGRTRGAVAQRAEQAQLRLVVPAGEPLAPHTSVPAGAPLAPRRSVPAGAALGARQLRRRAACGRLAAATLTVVGLAALWFGAGALRGLEGHVVPVRLAGTASVAGGYRYVAQPGDSLWSIAARVEPDSDPRPLVDELAAELHGRTLQPGDVLVLP